MIRLKSLIRLLIVLFAAQLWAQDDGYLFPMGISEGDEEMLETMPQKALLTRSLYESANLPNAVSLKMYAPSPRSQRNYGTCTAWAVTYAARTIVEAMANGWTEQTTIDQGAFTPAFTYRAIEPDNEKCYGAFTVSAVASLKDIGALPLTDWQATDPAKEFHCPDGLTPQYFTIAGQHKINDYARLFSTKESHTDKTDKVKLSLSNGNPVVISMLCPKSFHRVSGSLWTPEEEPEYGDHGRHAMTVVGYDNDKFGGAFEIQNSWGPSYGEGGYVWVRYQDFDDFVYGAIELFKMPPPEPEVPLFAGGLNLFDTRNQVDFGVNLLPGEGPVTYKVKESITKGDRIRLFIENHQSAYVYLLGSGSVDRSVVGLFPNEGESALLNYEQNVVPIPGEEYYIEADDTKGVNYLALLYAKEPLDLENLIQELNALDGTIDDRLEQMFSSRIIETKNTNPEVNTIAFQAMEQDANKVMALIIAIDHI